MRCFERGKREREMEQKKKELRLIDGDLVNTFIKKRDRELHKGDCGRVLVIAGKEGMAGAAVLSARGALRAGAGLVRISAQKEIYPILQIGVPEATCISRTLLPEELNGYQAVVMGPGLGDEDKHADLIENVFQAYEGPLVLDADGLNLLARNMDWLKLRAERPLILTPHPGEGGRLLGLAAGQVNGDRETASRRLADLSGAVTVLKGAGTLVSAPGKPTYINTTGNPGMATGGSGDVLSGIIGALAGQGLSCFHAALAGVYLHGLAGDLAADALGEYGMRASDIAAFTPLALKKTIG